MESGKLTSAEVESLGVAFVQIGDRTSDIPAKFGLEEGALSLNINSTGREAADAGRRD